MQLLLARDCGVLAQVRAEQRGLAHVVLTQQRLDLARERPCVRVTMHPVQQLQRNPPFAVGDEGQKRLCRRHECERRLCRPLLSPAVSVGEKEDGEA